MPSLMQCVISDLEPGNDSLSPEELIAQFDLDEMAIAEIQGAWEQVDVGPDRKRPKVDGLNHHFFYSSGPSLYHVQDFIIVRGIEDGESIYFVYEQSM